MFPHCMFRVEVSYNTLSQFSCMIMTMGLLQNIVPGIPKLTLPDVCTSSPVRGKAFCHSHCTLIEKEAPHIPVGLRDFLKFCGGYGMLVPN